jgi:excisionase family DNA binding protein
MAIRRYTDVSSSLPEYVQAKEIAIRFDLPEKRIYEWARSGRLPCVEFGRALRFRVEDVMEFVEANKRTRGIPE